MDSKLIRSVNENYDNNKPDLPPASPEAEEMLDLIEETDIRGEDLTTKNAVKFLLNGTLRKNVCRYCLKVTPELSELDQVLQIAGEGVLYKVTIREMIASFHFVKVIADTNIPNKICNSCVDRTLSSYLFAQQCERSERALRNCLEDMSEKLNKLDSLQKTKKRGRQKLKPNYNVLYTEHEKVLNYAEPRFTMINIGSDLISEDQKKGGLLCPKCWQDMPNVESLLNHEKCHPKTMWCHCHLCGKSFPKRNHLKRHILSVHDTEKEHGKMNALETEFKCQDCGVSSSDYQTHLQHIEKHKFKTVMECLLSKKMDKICAVCLNEGSKLNDLENTICLHGGYPEVMGNRTLYNILGSTFPEKSTYKYQELLVPTQAKTLKLANFKTINIEEADKLAFVLSTPIVLTRDVTDLDSVQYNCVVNSPSLEIDNYKTNEYFICNNVTNLALTNLDLGNTMDVINENAMNNGYDKVDKIHATKTKDIDRSKFTFSNPIIFKVNPVVDRHLRNNFDKNNEITINKTNHSCKNCWIFEGTSNICPYDRQNMQSEKYDTGNNKLIKTQNKCSSCWLFKNYKECCNCKSSNINHKTINAISNVQTLKRKVTMGNSGPTPKTKRRRKNEKRRKNKEISKSVKFLSKFHRACKTYKTISGNWQCKICLTSNSDRMLCLCCDSPRHSEHTDFNFNLKENVFTSKTDNTVIKNEMNSENMIEKTELTELTETSLNALCFENNEDMCYVLDNEAVNSENDAMNGIEVNSIIALSSHSNKSNADMLMIASTEESKSNPIEEMDITDNVTPQIEDFSIISSVYVGVEKFCNPNADKHLFQFSIGSSSGNKTQRKKRPINRKTS